MQPTTKIKRYMDENGLTQTDFAKRLGVTQGWLSRLLRGGGKRRPGLEMAEKLRTTVGIELTEWRKRRAS